MRVNGLSNTYRLIILVYTDEKNTKQVYHLDHSISPDLLAEDQVKKGKNK